MTEDNIKPVHMNCAACSGDLSPEELEQLRTVSTEKHAKLHITYTKGPFKMSEDDLAFGGESPWGKRTEDPFLFIIDNLLFGTDDVGLGDIVRCEVGDFGEYEIVEVIDGVPCLRGLLDYGQDLEKHAALVKDLYNEFTEDEVAIEGGFGALVWQCGEDVLDRLTDFFDNHDSVVAYSFEPSPALMGAE